MKHPSLKSLDTRRSIVARLVLVVLAAAAVYLVYEFGRIRAGYNIADAVAASRQHDVEIAALEARIAELQQQVVGLRTDRDIERESYGEVEQSLTELQAKIQEQSDAIAFYRGIVSPADGRAGLRVQDLKLSRAGDERAFNLRLVLVQAMQHDRKVSGSVNVQVAGSQDGVDRTYDYRELLPAEADAEWPFSFRYFQDFDRQLVLPDGFTPASITVEVLSRTRSIESIEESFAWSPGQG